MQPGLEVRPPLLDWAAVVLEGWYRCAVEAPGGGAPADLMRGT
jgi:hypothetical protein